MKTFPISSQCFNGRLIGCSWLKPKQKKVFKQVRPCLNNLIKNKDYDLKVYLSFGELRIAVNKRPEYSVIDSNNPDIWINRAKEIIQNFEQKIKL